MSYTASLWCVIRYHCGTHYFSHRFLSIVLQTYNINSGHYCWKTPSLWFHQVVVLRKIRKKYNGSGADSIIGSVYIEVSVE